MVEVILLPEDHTEVLLEVIHLGMVAVMEEVPGIGFWIGHSKAVMTKGANIQIDILGSMIIPKHIDWITTLQGIVIRLTGKDQGLRDLAHVTIPTEVAMTRIPLNAGAIQENVRDTSAARPCTAPQDVKIFAGRRLPRHPGARPGAASVRGVPGAYEETGAVPLEGE